MMYSDYNISKMIINSQLKNQQLVSVAKVWFKYMKANKYNVKYREKSY